MNLRPDQLAAQLERPLAPLWLLHGNEPLLVLEAADAIRAAARRQGYEERETLVVGHGFKWDALALAAGNLSLFGGAKLIDLRIPTGKPGRDGGDALQRYITALPAQTYDVLRKDSANDTIALLKRETARTMAPDRRDRIELAAIDFHWPNASLVHGLDNTLGYNPLRLGLYSKATGAGDHVALPDQRSFSPLMPGYRSLLADMLGLRFIATGVPVEQIDKRLKPGDLRQIARTKDAFVYENPRALPRVLVVTDARKADFDAILKTGAWPGDFDPRRTVLLDRDPPPLPTGPLGQNSVAIRDYGTTTVTLAAETARGGYLVLNDVWHHWWQVEIDGQRAELLRANVLFRAVVVPPGKSTVRFVFRPLQGLWHDIAAHLRAAAATWSD